jgi:alkylation response protein AidB-like acyl-CoA dehydrogenase
MRLVLSPDAQAVLEVVRAFVARDVLPRAAELDRQADPEACFSWDLVERADALGIRTITLERRYGGPAVDNRTTALAIAELAKGDLGVSIVFAQTWKLIQVLQAAGTEEQRERFLPQVRDDPRFLLAIAFTEPDTGSDYILPYGPARFRTVARRVPGGWRLNGMKHFIANGSRASLYLVFAQTDDAVPLTEGSTAFLVPKDSEGFRIGRVHDKLGERLVNNAELIFQDVFVPDENVLGEPHRGHEVQRGFFRASTAYEAACVLGVAEAAYGRALDWCRTRVQGGRRLVEHGSVAEDLAEMRMLLDTTTLYVLHAAESAQREELWDPTFAALPKVFASQVAWTVVTKALELHGGYGYMKEVGIEKLLRDAAAFLHAGGVNRTLLLKAAASLTSE